MCRRCKCACLVLMCSFVIMVAAFVGLLVLDEMYALEVCIHAADGSSTGRICHVLHVKNTTLEAASYLEEQLETDLALGLNMTSEMATRAHQIASDAVAAVQRG